MKKGSVFSDIGDTVLTTVLTTEEIEIDYSDSREKRRADAKSLL